MKDLTEIKQRQVTTNERFTTNTDRVTINSDRLDATNDRLGRLTQLIEASQLSRSPPLNTVHGGPQINGSQTIETSFLLVQGRKRVRQRLKDRQILPLKAAYRVSRSTEIAELHTPNDSKYN
jgi:hypothetical protein